MSDTTKNWLILLVGVLAVVMVLKVFFDVTAKPIQSASQHQQDAERHHHQ